MGTKSRSTDRRLTPRWMVATVLASLAMTIAACGGGGEEPLGDGDESATAETEGAAAEGQAEEDAVDASSGEETGSEDTEQADTSERLSMSFSYFPAFHTMAVLYADSAGYFEDENLEVELSRGDSGGVQFTMVVAGEVDASAIELQNVARTYGESRELLHVFPLVDSLSMNLVVSNEALEEHDISPDDPLEDRIAALADMTIGFTSPNAPTEIFSRYLLREAGVDPDREGNLVSIGSPQNLLAALKTNQIDAFMLTPPTPNVPEIDGYGTVLIKPSTGEVPRLGEFPYIGVTVRKDWAEENGEALERFNRAVLRANQEIAADPKGSVDVLREWFPDMDEEVMLAGVEDMAPALHPDGRLTEEFVQDYLDLTSGLGMLELEELPPADEGALWTNDFLPNH